MAPRPPLLQRLRPWQWALLDVVAAVVLTAPWLGGGPVEYAVACVGIGVVLPFRRRFPLIVLAGVTAGTAYLAVSETAYSGYPPFTMVLALYTVVVTGGRRRALAVAAAFCAAAFAIVHAMGDLRPDSAVIPVTVTLLPLVVGDSIRQRQVYLEHRVDLERRAALTEERMRIARELHDVVAHALSLITVQAGVARHKRPPVDDLVAALGSIEQTGRSGLVEMRRLLAVLRDGQEEDGGTAPQPGLDRLEELISAAAGAGLKVTLRQHGVRRPLSPGADLTAYRIVQESLTNVVRHSGAPSCHVTLTFSAEGLCVRVGNAYSASLDEQTPGHGLRGMAERVKMFDGTLRAGPHDGTWTVEAWIPDPLAQETP